MIPPLPLLPLLGLAGCAIGPGHGYGELSPVAFSAALTPGAARDLGGAVLTDQGYAVALDAFTWEVGSLHLMELQGGSGGTFDPATPPEGYGLCHGGHCHRDDGALVDYADIEAELAGDAATFEAVVSLPPPPSLDMLAGTKAVLIPARYVLGDVSLTKIRLESVSVAMSGVVTREATDTEGAFEATFDLSLALSGDLDAGLELPLGRGELPVIALSVSLAPDGTLWDELDFAALAADGGIDGEIPAGPESDLALALAARLSAVEPLPALTRSDWE